MISLDLRIGRIARRNRLGEDAAFPQARGDHLDAVGPLGMSNATQVIAVKRVGDEPQLECFAGAWQASLAAFCTVA